MTTRQNPLDPAKEAAAVKALRESLAAVDADDEQLLLDSIEGQTNLFEIIDRLLDRIADNVVLLDGLDSVISRFDERRARYRKRVDDDRALIEQAMLLAELQKVERPIATLSLARRAPKIEVSEESDIPAEFWKPGEPKLDKKALLDALKEGRTVPGAALSNCAPSLTIRNA